MELARLTERVLWVSGPANVGVIILDNSKVALIDSGCDAKFAKKLYELLSDYRFKVSHILNTHAHADHIAGNSFFQDKYNCKILASPLEAPTIRQPLIQCAVLFAGAPINDLMNRFLLANPSQVEVFQNNELILDDMTIKVLDLPGHSVNQKGFLVDGVAFVADTLFPDNFFNKQRLPFNYDPNSHAQTLVKMLEVEARCYIGGHFPPQSTIKSLVANNLSHLNQSLDFMRELLKSPMPQERVIKSFLDHYGLKKTNWEYYLYRASVNGYIAALYKRGEVKYRVLDNLPVWYAV